MLYNLSLEVGFLGFKMALKCSALLDLAEFYRLCNAVKHVAYQLAIFHLQMTKM